MLSDRTLSRLTSLLPDSAVRLSGKVQAWAYRRSGGRIGGRFAGEPVLLITTTGRKSGQPRTTTVLYGHGDGDSLIVVGSNTGSERPPAWALNLQAQPEATLRIGSEERRVRARVAAGEERERLWRRMNDGYGGFDDYRERTSRDIKLFVLE